VLILSRLVMFLASFCSLTASGRAQGTEALGGGMSAAAEGRGGTTVAERGSPLESMEGNPAGLAGLETRVLELSAVGMLAGGSFRNTVDPDGGLHGAAGALPYGAYAMPIGAGGRWTAGLAVTPESLTRVDWRYVDPPGTAGVSYGYQNDESKIVNLRSAAGLALSVGSRWSVGATLGLAYNTNTLNAPYIFQEQAQLAGLKVLLDLNTRGFGWNGSAGAQWQPSQRLRFGAAWKSGSYVQSHGSAKGSASALFAALGIPADPGFTYRAEVDNHLPQAAAAGLRWEQSRHLYWSLEGKWVDWGDAFRVLPVKLKQGSNATINSVAGSNAIEDEIALHWHNQGALHTGLEIPLPRNWMLRAGYAYMSNPVPSATLTPLTAAILRNSVSAGADWARGAWTYSVAYQTDLPASQSVGQSELRAGEYSNSHVQVHVQSITITSRVSF
jgi:long-subunit fatty acid transport protein